MHVCRISGMLCVKGPHVCVQCTSEYVKGQKTIMMIKVCKWIN